MDLTALFEQPVRVRSLAAELPDEARPKLAAVATACWTRQIPDGELHEHVSASIHLLSDQRAELIAAALHTASDERSLWNAWIDLSARRRRIGAELICMHAAASVVEHSGDVDMILDRVLPFLNVDGMNELHAAAESLNAARLGAPDHA